MKRVDIDLLDEFFSNSLDNKRKIQLRERLKSDPKFNRVFQEYEDLHKGIDYSILKSTKEDLQALEATLPEISIHNSSPKRRLSVVKARFNTSTLVRMAAAFLLIALSGVAVIMINNSSDPNTLFAKNFEPYPNDFIQAERGSGGNEVLMKAFQAYDVQNFQQAIPGFQKYLNGDQTDHYEMVLFYLGNAQIANEQYEDAIITLNHFLASSDQYVSEGTWYLALSHLRAGNLETANYNFSKLSSNVYYGAKCKKIIKKLPKYSK